MSIDCDTHDLFGSGENRKTKQNGVEVEARRMSVPRLSISTAERRKKEEDKKPPCVLDCSAERI